MNQPFSTLVELARNQEAAFADVQRQECVEAGREYYQENLAAIRKRHDGGASGANIVAALSTLADEVVAGAVEFALFNVSRRKVLVERMSLCAQGGYGRAQLNPHSDLDIGILYTGRLNKAVQAVVEYLGPYLWDIGYSNSCVVRNVREAVGLSKRDIRVYTSYLECRLLYGGSAAFARLQMSLRALRPGQSPDTFGLVKLRERGDSLSEEHRDLYAAEPNVKESAGGLRDYHAALWLLNVTYGTPTLDSAAARGFIGGEERLELAEALDLLWRVRNELHFHAGKAEDRLTRDNQSSVARAFEYTDEMNPDTSRFLQDYYTAARKIRRFLRKVARMCDFDASAPMLDVPRPEVPELTVEDDELYAGLQHPKWFEENPSRLMAIFWKCAQKEVTLSHPTEQLVEANLNLIGDTFRASDMVRRYFVSLCNRPLQAGSALRQAAQTGVLGRYLPEFAAVQDIIRYPEFHSFPVDEHTLRAVEALSAVPNMQGPVGNALKLALENVAEPYILVIALLLHDLGKASGEQHVEEGAVLAHQICTRIGMSKEEEERIVFLVAHHMVMSEVGLYRDTDDEDVIAQFAKTMKTEERLRSLFLLTYADMSAVGPNVWNDWKGTLLFRLYLRTEMVLLGRSAPLEEEFWDLPKANEIRSSLPDEMKGSLEGHLKDLGPRYFLAFTGENMKLHLECLTEAEKNGFAMRWAQNDETDMTEVVISTRDHRGLFAEIAGCFASQLVDVTSAALFSRADGLTVDVFTVLDARRHCPLTTKQLNSTEQTLMTVLTGEESVENLLEESGRRLFGLLQQPITAPTRVQFDNDVSRTHTVLDVVTPDRTGLLHTIASVIAEKGYDISSARVVTDARRVRDSFYITTNESKLEDQERQAELSNAIKDAIHPRPALQT